MLVFGFLLSLHPIILPMKKERIDPTQYNKILECFMKSLMQNGLKGTTMDSLASALQMSKRTLYEIFGNKEELFKEVHLYFHKKMAQKLSEIFLTSTNVMEAIIKCFLYNRDFMSNLCPDFIRDMQSISNQRVDKNKCAKRQHHQNLYEVLQKGVEEGYFREDVNLMVQCRMFLIQMESLKRTEDLFPEDISLLEIYDNIIIGFLRGISSQKGLDELEKYIPELTSFSKKQS